MSFGVVGNDKENKLLNLEKKNKYQDKSYVPKFNNKNDAHAYVCQNIEKNSLVLDVGCADGCIGKILKEELGCEVVGIELDEVAAKNAMATGYYKKVYNLDVTCEDSPLYQKFIKENNNFDCIIFSDVLEHLVNPAKVLYGLGKILKESGHVSISLPNIAHYDIINGLMQEKFNYSDMGLLDNTHLRFFTKYSFLEYLKSANVYFDFSFDASVINKTIVNPPCLGDNPLLDELMTKNPDMVVLQNIFWLTKRIDNNTPNLDQILAEKRIDLPEILEGKLQSEVEYKKKYKKLEKSYDSLQKEKAKLSEECFELKKQYQELEYHYLKTRANYDMEHEELNRVLYSRSWRYTRPIRGIKRYIEDIPILWKSISEQKAEKKSILMLVHAWVNIYDKNKTDIGGTTAHVMDLVNELKNKTNIYVLSIINNRYVLITFEGDKQKIYDLQLEVKVHNFDGYDFQFLTLLLKLLNNLEIDIMHIQHILGFPCDLSLIPNNIKKVLTVHDYSLICSRHFLIDYKGKGCLDKSYGKCKRCIKNLNVNLDVRENAVANLIKNVDKVILPDESVALELQKYLTLNNYEIIPHGLDSNYFTPFKVIPKNKEKKKNIAFVGYIPEHKGLKYMQELITNNDDDNIVYHLFGASSDMSLNKSGKNYVYHGPYNRKDLPKLLNDEKIDLVLLLSTCLETFSYTLSEVMMAHIPVITFDIGALGNRVSKNGLGWVISKDSTTSDIIKMYSKVFDSKEYNKILANIDKYHDLSIEQMVKKVDLLYESLYNQRKKKIIKVEKYISRLPLKYKI